jgi:hypothetical protein
MNEPHGASGRFWIPDSEIEPVPSPAPVLAAPSARPLSLAAERWLGLAAVIAMIGLSDLLMFISWH